MLHRSIRNRLGSIRERATAGLQSQELLDLYEDLIDAGVVRRAEMVRVAVGEGDSSTWTNQRSKFRVTQPPETTLILLCRAWPYAGLLIFSSLIDFRCIFSFYILLP